MLEIVKVVRSDIVAPLYIKLYRSFCSYQDPSKMAVYFKQLKGEYL